MSDVLYVNLDALTTEYNKKIDAAIGRLEKLGDFAEQNTDKANKSASSWGSNLINMAKGFIAVDLASRVAGAVKQVFLLEESFKTALMPLQGITEKSGNFGKVLEFNKELADKYGQSIFVLAEEYKSLYATSSTAGMSLNATNSIYESLIKTGAGLKLSNERISLSMRAITQMIDKQVVSSEELKGQLAEHIPGAYGLMAKAAQDAGISTTGTTQELAKLLEQGKVASTVVLPFFAKRMEEAFGKNAEQNVNTLSGSANRMRNELTYMMEALDNGKVLSFWASMQNGIANVFKDLTYYINQGSFKEFITHFGVNGGLTGNRKAKESMVKQDLDRFNSQTPEKKTAEYQRLNSELAQAVKNSRDLIKAGIEPNTDFLTKAAAKLKLYRENLADANKAGGTPPLPPAKGAGSGGVKDIKDYSMEMKILAIEAKEAKLTMQDFYDMQEKQKLNGFTPAMADNTGIINAEQLDWFNQMAKAVGFDGDEVAKRSQEIVNDVKNKVKPVLNDLGTSIHDDVITAISFVPEGMNLAFSFLGDTLANGFASVFNQDIKFDFKRLLGSFLAGLGEMVMKMALQLKVVAALKTKVEAAMLAFGGGGAALGGAIALFALGAAMKGGGMAMSANSNLGASTQRNTGGGASNGPGFGSNGLNITFNPVVLEAQGSALKGAIDVANYKFG
jgi:tape measure domain-containing protein